MKKISSIIEQGNYDQCKRQALESVVVPRLGSVYRLLQDEYAAPWTLKAMVTCREERWRDAVEPDDSPIYRFEFICVWAFDPSSLWRQFLTETTQLIFRMSRWPEKLQAGEIAVEGEDLPPGSIREWAIKKGISYVLSFDYLSRVVRDVVDTQQTIDAYDRIQEFNAARASTRRLESVRRAVYRGSVVDRRASAYRQLRPKNP